MKKRDALGRLMEYTQPDTVPPCDDREGFRRAVRALLRERAKAAQRAVRQYEEDTGILFDVNVSSAVLSRPKRRAK